MEKEKRIASVFITIEKNSKNIPLINKILGDFSQNIISRQGLSLPDKSFNIITLIINSDINTINALAGKIGKIKDAKIKITINKSKN